MVRFYFAPQRPGLTPKNPDRVFGRHTGLRLGEKEPTGSHKTKAPPAGAQNELGYTQMIGRDGNGPML